METIQKYKPLGEKTLGQLILKRTNPLLVILLILAGIYIASKFVPAQYSDLLANIILVCIIAFIISAIVVISLGWLEYSHYGIFLEENSFRITRGMFSEEEKGISYRFVQEVRVERSIVDQIFGVSNIVVMVLGESEGHPFSEMSKIVIPSIGKNIAIEIQNGILNRSGVARKTISG